LKRKNNFQGMTNVIAEVIKKNIAKARTYNHSCHAPEKGPFQGFQTQTQPLCPEPVADQKIGDTENHQVHEPVPPYLERPYSDHYRIDIIRKVLPDLYK
jgi:hypothetical protein